MGSPFEKVNGVRAAGFVNLIYGGSDGLSAAGNQIWHQGKRSILDLAEDGDRFG